MAENIKKIMTALDNVLNQTVWVNSERQIVSLAEELHVGAGGQPRTIEDLSRGSLIGALVSLQIRADDFSVSAESLDGVELAAKVKSMVFAQAKCLMDEKMCPARRVA